MSKSKFECTCCSKPLHQPTVVQLRGRDVTFRKRIAKGCLIRIRWLEPGGRKRWAWPTELDLCEACSKVLEDALLSVGILDGRVTPKG